jgi:nucleotide-binding universal stress UspA family protein
MAQLTSPVELSWKNILVVTDLSAHSVSALTCVVPIATQSDSVIHLLPVIRPEIKIALSGAHGKLQIQMDAQRQLGTLEMIIATVPHKIWRREGNVWRSIKDLVQSEHIDLIVVGISGESDFMGSGAEEVMRKAVCSVLTVGPHVSSSADKPPLAQVLYVMNLWEESHDGLEYAIQLAIRYKSRLLLLHVVEQEESKQSDHEWLKAFRRIMRNLLPESAANLAEGPVLRVEVARNISARILQVADEIRADLVVMEMASGGAGATHLPQKLYEIISRASCPVLTTRSAPQG